MSLHIDIPALLLKSFGGMYLPICTIPIYYFQALFKTKAFFDTQAVKKPRLGNGAFYYCVQAVCLNVCLPS